MAGLKQMVFVLAVCTSFIGFQASAEQQKYKIELALQQPHTGPLAALQFSPDSRTLVSASDDGRLKLWDIRTGRLIRTLAGHEGGVISMSVAPSGQVVASGGVDKVIRLWDLASGRLLKELTGHRDGVWGLAFSPDSKSLLSAGLMHPIIHWDVTTGARLRTYDKDQKFPVVFSPDGKQFASDTYDFASGEQVPKIWDVATGELIKALQSDPNELAYSLAYSADGRRIVAGQFESAALYDVTSGKLLRTFKAKKKTVQAWSAKFTGNPDQIVTAGGPVKLWSVKNDEPVWRWKAPFDETLGFPSASEHIALSPNGKYVAVNSDTNYAPFLLDSKTGRFLKALGGDGSSAHAVRYVGNGDRVKWLRRGQITTWDASSGQAQALPLDQEFDIKRATLGEAAFSSDGRYLITGYWDTDMQMTKQFGAMTLWRTSDGRGIHPFNKFAHPVFGLSFSPDGRQILSGHHKFATLWQAETGKLLHSLEGHTGFVYALQFATDGKHFATGGQGGDLFLWDTKTGKQVRAFKGHKIAVDVVRFSADGQTLLSGARDKTLKLWNVSNGQLIRTFKGHTETILTAAISMDNQLIVSGSGDATVRLWEVATGKLIHTLRGHEGAVISAAMQPDSRRVASAGRDGTVRIWSTDGKHVATVASEDGKSWITITPEGFFTTSSDGAGALHLVRGMEVLAIEQVYDALHRPDLVREALAGDPNGKVKEAAARLDLDKVIRSGLPPDIEIASPETGTEMQTETVKVNVRLSPRKGGVGRIEWRVNGKTQGVDQRGFERFEKSAPSSSAAKSIIFEKTLALLPGENRIQIVAYNKANLIASEPAEIRIKAKRKRINDPKLYVLAVGINDYWDSRLRLNYAVSDAKAIAAGMKRAGKSIYGEVITKLVLNGSANRDVLDKAFVELGAVVRPGDVFMMFLAGHGKTEDGRYYFLPQNFRYVDEGSIARDGIGQDQWQLWLSRIKAQKSILLYDTCESGSLTGDRKTRGLEEVAAIARLTRAMGHTILTASTDTAPALEGFRGHGAFTYTLLEALANADNDNDQQVEVAELAAYVDKALPDLSFKAFGHRQVPQMKIVGNSFPLGTPVAILDAAAPIIPKKSTHFVIKPAALRENSSTTAEVLNMLKAGTAVRVIELGGEWALIARDGRKLGYVRAEHLLQIQ